MLTVLLRSWDNEHMLFCCCRTWMADDFDQCCARIEMLTVDDSRWVDVMERARNVSKQQSIELDQTTHGTNHPLCPNSSQLINALLPAVTGVGRWITASRTTSSRESATSLYFHWNPHSRSSPRDFWGFFSVSPDPCAKCTGLNDGDWHYEYEM